MLLALAQWWRSRWLLLAQGLRKQQALERLAWQQVPGSAWQQRQVFSLLAWLLVLLRQVLQPVLQRQAWLPVSLRQWPVWRPQVLQRQFSQPVWRLVLQQVLQQV